MITNHHRRKSLSLTVCLTDKTSYRLNKIEKSGKIFPLFYVTALLLEVQVDQSDLQRRSLQQVQQMVLVVQY